MRINGYRRHTAGGNPAMDYHPVQGVVAILLGRLHATETGISYGRVGLWLVFAFTITLHQILNMFKRCSVKNGVNLFLI